MHASNWVVSTPGLFHTNTALCMAVVSLSTELKQSNKQTHTHVQCFLASVGLGILGNLVIKPIYEYRLNLP